MPVRSMSVIRFCGRARGASSALAAWALSVLGAAGAGEPSDPADPATFREAALADLHVLRDYRAGKFSFVESPERHPGAWTGIGYRHVLGELEGPGSVRHIWTTRGEGEPPLTWEFFVDGETSPSLAFTDEEMARLAAQVNDPVAPRNALPAGRRDFNFFLPIPFDRSLRIEVVQRVPSFWLWFCQIDWRTGDPSMAGARLVSRGEGTARRLIYTGLPASPVRPPRACVTNAFPERVLAPGAEEEIGALAGAGIVRELRLRWTPGAALRLRTRCDGAATFAVDAPVDRFFGPFRGTSLYRHALGEGACHLPMPLARGLGIVVSNEGADPARVSGWAAVEPVAKFAPDWGYLHARHQATPGTDGHRLHQVLYVRGRGQWVGMSLFGTGHDHGGGDFVVVDGEGARPGFLHGINGEDYFTFAWFGRGAHHPYAIAHANEEGRYRHHVENVVPFRASLAVEWGAFPGLRPESVAVWYQAEPGDATVPEGARAESAEWDVFGPVPAPDVPSERPAAALERALPAVAALDAGGRFECRQVKERFESGWMKDRAVGPMLNLTYTGRHGTKIAGEVELGGLGHAWLARRFLEAEADAQAPWVFAHDDPAAVWVNGRLAYEGGAQSNGFATARFSLPLSRGRNELVVRTLNRFNRDFNWAGFLLRPEGARTAGEANFRGSED